MKGCFVVVHLLTSKCSESFWKHYLIKSPCLGLLDWETALPGPLRQLRLTEVVILYHCGWWLWYTGSADRVLTPDRDFFKSLIPERGIFKFSKNVFEFKVVCLFVYFLVTNELLEHCTEPWAWLQTHSLSVCSTFISPLSLHGFQKKIGRRRQSGFCVIICWDCFLEWVVTHELLHSALP